MGHIVVGIDGSPESKQALQWGVEEGRLRGAEVQVVYAYGRPEEQNPYAMAYWPSSELADVAKSEREWRNNQLQRGRQRAEALVHGVVHEVVPRHSPVRVEPLVVLDSRPVRALLQRARDADLLVVGSRGRRGLSGLLLGSISQQCVAKAPCPVVIVGSAAAHGAAPWSSAHPTAATTALPPVRRP